MKSRVGLGPTLDFSISGNGGCESSWLRQELDEFCFGAPEQFPGGAREPIVVCIGAPEQFPMVARESIVVFFVNQMDCNAPTS